MLSSHHHTFALPPGSSSSDPGSHSGPSSPLPTTVRALFFIAIAIQHFLPSSTRIELCDTKQWIVQSQFTRCPTSLQYHLGFIVSWLATRALGRHIRLIHLIHLFLPQKYFFGRNIMLLPYMKSASKNVGATSAVPCVLNKHTPLFTT